MKRVNSRTAGFGGGSLLFVAYASLLLLVVIATTSVTAVRFERSPAAAARLVKRDVNSQSKDDSG